MTAGARRKGAGGAERSGAGGRGALGCGTRRRRAAGLLKAGRVAPGRLTSAPPGQCNTTAKTFRFLSRVYFKIKLTNAAAEPQKPSCNVAAQQAQRTEAGM